MNSSLVVADDDNDGLIDVNDTNNTITLTFDENVYATPAELEATLVIKDKDGKRLGTSAYDVTVVNAGNLADVEATVRAAYVAKGSDLTLAEFKLM